MSALRTLLLSAILGGGATPTVVANDHGDLAAPVRDWRANTFTRSTQAEATIATLSTGDVLVAWSSRRQHHGKYGVFAQRFTDDGIPVGSEMPITLWPDGHQSAPAIAVADDGRIWMAWESFGQDGDAGSILVRAFDDIKGTLVGGDELLVNDRTEGHQTTPALLALANGAVVVLWTDRDTTTGAATARWRCITRHGMLAGMPAPSTPITAGTGTHTAHPVAARTPDGFAVAVALTDASNIPFGIGMQRFIVTDNASPPTPHAALTIVSEPDARFPIEPTIACAGDTILVGWLELDEDRARNRSRFRISSIDGMMRTAVRTLDDAPNARHQALTACAMPDSAFTLAWNRLIDDQRDVVTTTVRPTGDVDSARRVLHTRKDGDQWMTLASGATRLTATHDGTILAAWNGDGGFGDSSGVHVSALRDRPGNPMLTPGITADMEAVSMHYIAAADGPAPHVPPTFDPERAVSQDDRISTLGTGTIGFDGLLNTGWDPPDPAMAVGPAHIVVMTNGGIAFLTKTGTLTFQDQIEGGGGFWGTLGATGFVFDPETLYDTTSGRFFAMASEDAPGGQSFILLAVSDDDNPNGSWNKYRVDTTSLAGNTYDSPNMSVDANVLYITGDAIGGLFAYPIFTFDKADLLAGLPLSPAQSMLLPTATQSAGIPAVMDATANALYLIEHQEGLTNSQVRLIAITNPLTDITITTMQLNVPNYRRPTDLTHLGSSGTIETFDARLWSVDYRNGSLWATHHVGSNDGSKTIVRWYEIATNGWPTSGQTPTLEQIGTIDPGGNTSAYFSAIGVDGEGNAAVTYARSAPDTFISMVTSNRNADDPAGVMGNATVWRTNNAGINGGRWGDYARVQADPVDDSLWATHEYAIGTSWRTWVQNIAPPPPSNNNCQSPAVVNEGDTPFNTEFALSTGDIELCGDFQSDVWFRFVATRAGTLTINTCDADFDTQLALYSFACPAGPNEALACSDDACGTGSSLTHEVTGPGLFRIRVGGAKGATGNAVLSIAFGGPEPTPCPADCAPDNGNGSFGNATVNIDDLLAVINAFGAPGGPCDVAPDNGDGTFGNGTVNIDDLLVVVNAFGDCPR
jgi:hypothetical protein